MVKAQGGFTLVEVLIAMAVLSIVILSFTQVLGFSVTGIFNEGEKSRALAEAREKTDDLFYLVASAATPEDAMAGMEADAEWVAAADDLYDTANPAVRRFCYEPTSNVVNGVTVEGYNVTVVIYYRDFQSKVELESFIGDYE